MTDLLYESLRNDIIKSYTSGDLDNSVGQMDMSLELLNRLYDREKFGNGDITKERLKLLAKIQGMVDKRVGNLNE